MDKYQERYLAHQKRKQAVLAEIMSQRHSERVFLSDPVSESDLKIISYAAESAPSSCDRKAVNGLLVTDRHLKNLLSGLLVGGVGWIHRAPLIVTLFADMDAYKSPDERIYMPYLDAGHLSQNIQLAVVSCGLSSCYCNPNCHYTNVLNKHFAPDSYGDPLFVGAIAIGKKHA